MYELLSSSFQGVKRLFAFSYVIAADAANNETDIKSNRKYFLLRGETEDCNVLIEGINFL